MSVIQMILGDAEVPDCYHNGGLICYSKRYMLTLPIKTATTSAALWVCALMRATSLGTQTLLQTESRNTEGRTYWFHEVTEESRWDKPDGTSLSIQGDVPPYTL